MVNQKQNTTNGIKVAFIGIKNNWQTTDQIERQRHGRYFTHYHQLRKSIGTGFFVLVMATIVINALLRKKSMPRHPQRLPFSRLKQSIWMTYWPPSHINFRMLDFCIALDVNILFGWCLFRTNKSVVPTAPKFQRILWATAPKGETRDEQHNDHYSIMWRRNVSTSRRRLCVESERRGEGRLCHPRGSHCMQTSYLHSEMENPIPSDLSRLPFQGFLLMTGRTFNPDLKFLRGSHPPTWDRTVFRTQSSYHFLKISWREHPWRTCTRCLAFFCAFLPEHIRASWEAEPHLECQRIRAQGKTTGHFCRENERSVPCVSKLQLFLPFTPKSECHA